MNFKATCWGDYKNKYCTHWDHKGTLLACDAAPQQQLIVNMTFLKLVQSLWRVRSMVYKGVGWGGEPWVFAFPDPPRHRMVASHSCYLKDDRVILVFPALTLEGETVWRDIRQHRVRVHLDSHDYLLTALPLPKEMAWENISTGREGQQQARPNGDY